MDDPQATQTPLPEALNARRGELGNADTGRVAYYSDHSGRGRPLLLIHSINAAPSSFEVKPLFEGFSGKRPVYSVELPGFGHSERSERTYTPELFADAIRIMLEDGIGTPADVVALSLSAEFAARAMCRKPDCFSSLVLISPTGFARRNPPSPALARTIHRILSLPLWSQALFRLVSSRPSIRHYLGKSFLSEPPQALLDYAYATAHQPGARHAPLTFLSTKLFTRDAATTLYAPLRTKPVLVIADRDPYVDFDRLPAQVQAHDNWYAEAVGPHRGLPHWESPEKTIETLNTFWEEV